ncbi:transcription factor IBH1 [Trifolium repens]|nr:transcription factor IBH1 [Trifolium repens]
MNFPPGNKLFSLLVLFLTNRIAIKLASILSFVRFLLKIFLLPVILFRRGYEFVEFFLITFCGDEVVDMSCSLSMFVEVFANRAFLQRVVLSLVEAMAKSAESFIAFFLSNKVMFFF